MKLPFLLTLTAACAGAQIYVSPAGNDANAGARGAPVKTIEHARDLVRARTSGMQADLEVVLENGTYRLSGPLALDTRDSGSGGHRVIYRAAEGAHPVISGGVRVTGWKEEDVKRHLWSAPAPEGLTNTRQLYVEGVRATRARGRVPAALTKTATGYTASNDAMAKWRNAGDIEFVYTGGNSLWSEHEEGLGSWTEPRCPVAKIDGAEITMAQPCWDNSTKRIHPPQYNRPANLVGPASVGKEPAYVENAFELLGTPGQWYFDRAAKRIYYVPRAGEDLRNADVEAPSLEKLIDADGVHDVTFAGIQFSYATWLAPSTGEGFSEIQANYMVTGPDGWRTQGLCKLAPEGRCPYGAWEKAPGNVSFRHAARVAFSDDVFVHLGAAGLDLGSGARECKVEGSVFTDISGNGLQLGAVDSPEAADDEITDKNRVANDHFYEIGAEYHGGIAIVIGYARDTVVEYNQIDHIPYAGMSIGWGGWPDKIKQAGVTNFSRRNRIANNLIYDFMLLLSDGGGIYTQGRTGLTLEDGEKVESNVIYSQFSSGHGIYTDNGSRDITVRGNVIFRTNHDNWGSRHRDYYDGADGKNFDPLLIEGNYWQQGDADVSRENVTEQGNHLINSLEGAPRAIRENAGIRPEWRKILAKRFTKEGAPDAPNRVAATMANGFALVSWNPSLHEGGAPVTSYIVRASNGAQVNLTEAAFEKDGYARVEGLSAGSDYTFTVIAKNAHGPSVPSLPSRPVHQSATPLALPVGPVAVKALPSDGMVSIHFQDPRPPKGSSVAPIIAYVVTVHPTERKVRFTGRPILTLDGTTHTTFQVIDGLKRGKSYTFDVSAESTAGVGPRVTVGPVEVP